MTSKSVIRAIMLLSACLFLLVCCAPQADFDVRGEWEYTMTALDGNTYDIGLITFEGRPERGTYRQVNIYQVEYKGEFTMRGNTLKLTGDQTWSGELIDANTIQGTWRDDSGSSGNFIATRK